MCKLLRRKNLNLPQRMSSYRPMLLFIGLCSSVTLKANDRIEIRPYRGSVPAALYHWTHQEELKMLVDRKGNPVFQHLADRNGIFNRLPTLKGVDGIFTWNHPTGGMAASNLEFYGNVCVKYKLKSSAKILHIKAGYNAPAHQLAIDTSGYDVIYHEIIDGRRRYFSEFIIINKQAVEYVTADPLEIQPEVRETYEKLQKKSFRMPVKDLHWNGHNASALNSDREGILRRLQEYFSIRIRAIPKKLLSVKQCESK